MSDVETEGLSDEQLMEILRKSGGVEIGMPEVPEEKEPELEELSPGAWKMELRETAIACIANMNVALEEYRKWEKHLHRCNELFIKANQLQDSKYRVRFFQDEEGNLSLNAFEKEDMGFTQFSKGGEDERKNTLGSRGSPLLGRGDV